MKREYEMTEQELKELMDAGKPVPYLVFGGIPPASPYDNAMRAWDALGTKKGFWPMTVESSCGKGERFFMAEPIEEKGPQ